MSQDRSERAAQRGAPAALGAAPQERSPPRFIAIEGPIGVGKTTLARRLADTFGHQLLMEDAWQNPFLERFYRNRREAALATQLSFLFQRVQQIQDLRQSDLFQPRHVADYLIEKDPLFARVNLDRDEYQLYEKIYRQLTIDAPQPDLVIYLQAAPDTLLQRIEHRGVAVERSIDRRYLEQLNEVYSEFFLYYDAAPLLIVNASAMDLAHGERDYAQFVDYLLDVRSGRHYFNPTFFG